MKHILTRLIPAALVLCLTLTACGGKDDGSGAGYDPAATAQALLDSGAFTDTLDTTDKDTVAVLYGVEADSIVDCACYTSLSAGAEEIAVLTMKDADSAKAAMAGMETRSASWTRPSSPSPAIRWCWWWPPTRTRPSPRWTA